MTAGDFVKGIVVNNTALPVYASFNIGGEEYRPRNSLWAYPEDKVDKSKRWLKLKDEDLNSDIGTFLKKCYTNVKLTLTEPETENLVNIGVLGYLCGRNIAYTPLILDSLVLLPNREEIINNGVSSDMYSADLDFLGGKLPTDLDQKYFDAVKIAAMPFILPGKEYDEPKEEGEEIVITGKRFLTGPGEDTYSLVIKGNACKLRYCGAEIPLFGLSSPFPNLPKTKPELFVQLYEEWKLACAEKIAASIFPSKINNAHEQ